MLETLKIKNLAVIDAAEIPFESGLNILSGETGAGKSIVLEAISLLLGSRANTELIRAGCPEASVEGLFRIEGLPWLSQRLERLGFEAETHELLIRRVISATGKHRIYVNGSLATLSTLQELCEGLIDLCGQHEHQSLIKPTVQLELLDRYGGLGPEARAFGERFEVLRTLERERAELAQSESDRVRKLDFLQFQIAELEAAELEPGEDSKLAAEKVLLQSSEARLNHAEGAREALEGEEGAIPSLRGALTKLKALTQLDPDAQGVREAVERAQAEAEEAALSLHRYLANVDMDPSRLSQVQERLAKLAEFRRKYGASVDEMLATLERLREEHSGLSDSARRLEDLDAQIERARDDARARAKKLTKKRTAIADLLAKTVTDELKDLKMSEAKFTIELETESDPARWSASGADQISFVVRTNKGETARPLGKIASGGELSRLMLALRRTIADKGGIGVYLFDEIDAGIGGQTAFQVGRKLKSVATHNQVLCITHLPQVAAFADHHLSVRKTTSGARTLTTVEALGARERREELARMLGGAELTKKSLENAQELIEQAR